MMNAIKNIFIFIFYIMLLIIVLLIRLIPLSLLIFLIIQVYFQNIEYQTAIFIAILVASVFSIFNTIVLGNNLITYNDGKYYSNSQIISLSILNILDTLIILASIIFFYLQNYTYAYYLCLLKYVINALYAINIMRYKELRIGSYISFGLNVIVLILGFIFIKHAEIILVVYYPLNYLLFLKDFYL